MCGICGVLSLDGAGVDRRVLDSMNETLVHRGPDSGRAFVNGRVGLAARRLAIIDLAGGDQPIANEDGSITVVQTERSTTTESYARSSNARAVVAFRRRAIPRCSSTSTRNTA
jgi:glutamine phosphoribosylpyrophosphate amidotransferase